MYESTAIRTLHLGSWYAVMTVRKLYVLFNKPKHGQRARFCLFVGTWD